MITFKVAIDDMRKDVDQLKSMNMSTIFWTIEFPDIPTNADMPSATTRDEVRVEKVVTAKS